MYARKSLLIIILSLVIGLPMTAFGAGLPAFPGAQGFGAKSVGGRGGAVIKVTNLNDSGTGSLRAAVSSSGPRIVVFTVSGIINLQSDLYISNPYITIAGQTSPGGVMVTGRTTIINTHDVVIQHMRFRAGSHNVANAESHDSLGIYGDAEPSWFPNPGYNIMIDHCSVSWGIDENFSLGLDVNDVTVQWSIVSEGLNNAGHPKGSHSKGLLVNTKYTTIPMHVSLHHNYFAHNADRNPLVSGTNDVVTDAVNNVAYNYKGALNMITEGNVKVNWIHNYSKPGPDSSTWGGYPAQHIPAGETVMPRIYALGNISPKRPDQSYDDWAVGYMWYDQLLNQNHRLTTKLSAPAVKTATSSLEMANCVLSAVGATAPARDSVDTRVLADFTNGTGRIRDNVSYPADFPVFSTPAAPTDADNDGMADAWETSVGLNIASNDSALDRNNDGYTNIEDYLSYLSTSSFTYNSACMPDTSIPAAPRNLTVR